MQSPRSSTTEDANLANDTDDSQPTNFSADDHKFMKKALDLAEHALSVNEVPVGCVFVLDQQIVASGINDTNNSLCGIRHAEILAVEEFLKKHDPQDFLRTSVYVTVEPCIMCASLLRQLRVKTIIMGCGNERFGGCGSILRIHRDKPDIDPPLTVLPGLYREEAIVLLRKFYIQENAAAPIPNSKKQRVLKLDFDPWNPEIFK